MRHSCSVACAAGSDDFQKRGRDRRTYQFERSSTSSASAWAPLSASNSSSASVTVRTVRCSRERDPAVEHVLGDGARPSPRRVPAVEVRRR